MRQWLPKRSAYLKHLLRTEANNVKTCTCCTKLARWRCLCCLSRPMFCRECCRITHKQLIYHRLQKWTGWFFQDAGLWEVGVRLSVGHMGEKCPSQGVLLEACRDLEARKDREDTLATENLLCDHPNCSHMKDPEWHDIPMLQTGPVPLRTPTPTMDDLDIEHILIVDASGLISLPAIWCACLEKAEEAGRPDDAEQMLAASYEKIKTVFSFHCLDDYRLSNLECKTSAYQYYQKLRRLTNPAFPHSVPNRYNEFCWATRQWRNLKLRKWFGIGHRLVTPSKGSMALFCAACPQPGVNLPADHMTRYTAFVVDGNFTANHIKQTRPHDDVWLIDGEGMMTARVPYASHIKIKEAKATKEKDPCESLESSFQAILDSNTGSGIKDITGIRVHACARHGCYAPSSCVNFTKGEQQKCIDYSLSETYQTTNCVSVCKLLEIYDIVCQYYKHIESRFAASPYISLPPAELEKAIGMFHVHGHQDSCFFQFATSFMKGAGMVDGEILETLWSTLNSISPSMRTASVAHRSEVLDDHMNDSNWKKIVSITRTIINKYNWAIKNELDSTAYFQDLSTVPTAEQMALWEKEISEAEVLRTKCPAEMNVMAPRIKKAGWGTAENISSLGKQRDNLVKSMSKFNTESQKYLGEAFVESLPQESPHRLLLTRFMEKELKLRRGHANDCLAEIRTIIGQEAFKYKRILQPANDKARRTRARSSIQAVHRTLVLQCRLYRRTRHAMLSLGMESAELTVYKELTYDDIKVSSAISNPNIPGSSRTQLSWIWTTHGNVSFQCSLCARLSMKTVYREEVILTRNEMHWATNYFTFRHSQWTTWQLMPKSNVVRDGPTS
ncbi:hypothetical protein BYT27DRAFT_7221526 [Phlegmacium glaucopus]|nr:hypothetical protein BYT27DRAFT_7221526 [Phlegmacium glaucopus]